MIKLIAAVSSNGIIGISTEHKLLWHYPEDLKFFKEKTINSTVIMGNNTFKSLNQKPLKDRTNIVISSQPTNNTNIINYHNINDALLNHKDCFIIGGKTLYEQTIHLANEIYLNILPDIILNKNALHFPYINPFQFKLDSFSKQDSIIFTKYVKI